MARLRILYYIIYINSAIIIDDVLNLLKCIAITLCIKKYMFYVAPENNQVKHYVMHRSAIAHLMLNIPLHVNS